MRQMIYVVSILTTSPSAVSSVQYSKQYGWYWREEKHLPWIKYGIYEDQGRRHTRGANTTKAWVVLMLYQGAKVSNDYGG